VDFLIVSTIVVFASTGTVVHHVYMVKMLKKSTEAAAVVHVAYMFYWQILVYVV
jgi:hypothetical protein